VKAEVDRGIKIDTADGSPLRFSADKLVALAEIPSTGRLVIGDRQGRLRLWDLKAGTAVSLIGIHNTAITSLTYHPKFGLVSGDRLGQIVRWDTDSGLILASVNVDAPVQAIRYSANGDQLAVLTGTWHASDNKNSVALLDRSSLECLTRFIQTNTAATLVEVAVDGESRLDSSSSLQLYNLDWQGELRSIENNNIVIGHLKKDIVSSLVLAQQTLSSHQVIPTPAVLPITSEPSEFVYVEQ
jgi:bla regulator protein blaR1